MRCSARENPEKVLHFKEPDVYMDNLHNLTAKVNIENANNFTTGKRKSSPRGVFNLTKCNPNIRRIFVRIANKNLWGLICHHLRLMFWVNSGTQPMNNIIFRKRFSKGYRTTISVQRFNFWSPRRFKPSNNQSEENVTRCLKSRSKWDAPLKVKRFTDFVHYKIE